MHKDTLFDTLRNRNVSRKVKEMRRSPDAQARNVAQTRQARKTKTYRATHAKYARDWRKLHPMSGAPPKAKRGQALRTGRREAKRGGFVAPIDAPLPVPNSPCDAGCGRVLTLKEMHLDHDHKTGRFRGWICRSCNHGIGMLGDTIEGVQNALDYLRDGPHMLNGRHD